MYNVALRIVGSSEEAEDVLQEAFLRAFDKLYTFSGASTFGAWLKRIVINQALTHVKQRKGEVRWDDHTPEPIVEYAPFDYDLHTDLATIKEAVKQLPDGFRMVFSLYLLEGYDHREIAEILDISESTSKSQLNRAKKKLLELIEGKVNYGTHR